jgi:maltose alpha-D-glucosyltransferase/alpha-amylase
LFRKVEVGLNPDLEISRFLTRREFPHSACLLGSLDYKGPDGQAVSLGMLSEFLPEATDGWQYTLDSLSQFYERVSTVGPGSVEPPAVKEDLIALARQDPSQEEEELLGSYLATARLLGDRTAALHVALGSEAEDPEFATEPFTPFYVRSVFQSMRGLARQNFALLRKRLKLLPESSVADAEQVLKSEDSVLRRLRLLTERRIEARRIRCHGDYHLGQVLHTGKDIVIIDFEGEPARSLSERRLKRCPLRDVAGMIRSFHYAAFGALLRQAEAGVLSALDLERFEPWARRWFQHASTAFLRAYFARMRGGLLPESGDELSVLLTAYLVDKAIYELGYELNNRPTWVGIPLKGILHQVNG